MSDYDDLLRAVCDSPAEDVPRLMLADLLDDRDWKGDREWADFIRVQVEIRRLEHTFHTVTYEEDEYGGITTQSATHPDLYLLRHRERELLEMMVPRQQYRNEDGRPSGARNTQGRYYFSECGCPLVVFSLRRGFLAEITVTTENFLAHAAEVFTRHPVERVTLAGKNPTDAEDPRDHRPFFWVTSEGISRTYPEPQHVPGLVAKFGNQDAQSRTMNRIYEFATAEIARAWLCGACVAFGRGTAAKAREGATLRI